MTNYRISIPHFYCLKYEDLLSNKTMIVDIDLRDKYKIVSLDCLSHWEIPYENEILDEKTKLEILNNVYHFLCIKFGKRYVINTVKKYYAIYFFLVNPFYFFEYLFYQKQTKKLIENKHAKLRKKSCR